MIAGEKLEREVERIYKLLGAKFTERRTLIKTYEIDVLAKFNKGPIEITVIVECKEYSGKKMVADEEMKGFAAKMFAAREAGIADKAVFVTTSGYTKNSLATAKMHNIQCLTLNDLANQLVNFDEYVSESLDEYKNSNLAKWYVSQKVSDIEDYNSISSFESKNILHNDAVLHLNQIIETEKCKRIAVLGNFGTGKTSLCIKYKNELLVKYLNGTNQRLPLLINLKDFRTGIDIHQLITSTLQNLPGVEIDLKLCLELQKMGRFIFILDGLDEMATRVDRIVINENIREIDRLFSENDNIYILTCRTHFFQERIADEFLKDYRVIFLMDWGRDELKQYLKARFQNQWESYLNRITSKITLEELAKTPMLLDMIIRSLSQIKNDDQINLISLYKTYTDDWIETQTKRRGAVMSTLQRRKFVEAIAKKIFITENYSIHFSELYEIAKETSGYIDATRIDYFDTDARTSTFVTKDSHGNYSFYHRSFMEYFCASIIINEVNTNNPSLIAQKNISNEIFDLMELKNISIKDGILNLQQWSANFKEKFLSRNATAFLFKLNQKIDKKVEEHFGFTKSKWDDLEKVLTNEDASIIEDFNKINYPKIMDIARGLNSRYNFATSDIEDSIQELMLRLWVQMKSGKLKANEHINLDKYIYSSLRIILRDKSTIRDRMQFEEFPNEGSDEADYIYFRNREFNDDEIRLKPKGFWLEVDKVLKKRFKKGKQYIQAFYEVNAGGEDIKNVANEMGVSVDSLRIIFNRMKHTIKENINLKKINTSQWETY